MTAKTTSEEKGERKGKFPIAVNRKPVEVDEELVTGLQVKEAAIKQGVSIQLDFQLAKVTPDGSHQIVGDREKVDVLEYKTFFATSSDDNA